jgi:polyisoprenoid-binding protein YceI
MANTKWTVDPAHSELGFKIKHLMISNVSGFFSDYSVDMQTTGEDFETASVVAKIKMESINTKNAQRDEHLRNSDFFETDKYPEMIFESTGVKKVDDETYLVNGKLTLKGITHPVQLNVEYSGVTKDPWGGERAGFIISGKIRRSDFGISFNAVLETGGVALSEEVKLFADLQLVKLPEAVVAQ